jgi:hypothetical protein
MIFDPLLSGCVFKKHAEFSGFDYRWMRIDKVYDSFDNLYRYKKEVSSFLVV